MPLSCAQENHNINVSEPKLVFNENHPIATQILKIITYEIP
jgi:hypothetical protein